MTNWKYDTNNATMDMLVSHAFVSKEDELLFNQNNCLSKVTPPSPPFKKNDFKSSDIATLKSRFLNFKNSDDICQNLITKINNLFSKFNIYNLYD